MSETSSVKSSLLASLDRMSAQELTALIEAAEDKRRDKLETAKQELIAEFRAKASELGLTMDSLFPQQGTPASARKQRTDTGVTRPARYRGPNGEEWSGRGRMPNWLAALEAEGRPRDQFAIAPESSAS